MTTPFRATFFVEGTPRAQPRARKGKGNFYSNNAGVARWKKAIWLAGESVMPEEPLDCAIKVDLLFLFRRPHSHYRSGVYSHILKDEFKEVRHLQKPDKDNLEKTVLDAMTKREIGPGDVERMKSIGRYDLAKRSEAGWFVDDSKVFTGGPTKVWANADQPEGVMVIVYDASDDPIPLLDRFVRMLSGTDDDSRAHEVCA